MAAPYEQKQRFRPVCDDPFPARYEAGRQNHPHHGRTADGGKMYGNRLFDYECEAGGRIFIDQRVQLRLIFVGGTGSGKSTSLASLIDYRNENSFGHIITIEDPIEFVHEHKNCIITQREVGVDTENWMAALKNTLRQAPDVILIGEIRDRETMDYAIAFAETGHLCMATLHANSTNQALDRIINFFPEERREQLLTDLSLNLQAFISQRLVPRDGGKGRVAAVEVLLNSPLISELIHNGNIHEIKEVMKKSTTLGMQTFDQHLYQLYEKGEISLQDALKNADSAHDLRLAVQLRSRRAQSSDPDLELL